MDITGIPASLGVSSISSGGGSSVPGVVNIMSSPVATASVSSPVAGSKQMSVTDTVKAVQQRIAQYGPGPHTPKQREELMKLNQLLMKAQPQAQAAIKSEMGGLAPVPQVGVMAAKSPGAHSMPSHSSDNKVLDKRRLSELVKEVDPLEQLDDDVEEMLMQIADDFIDSVVNASCKIAKHRKANTVEVKDVQLHLERAWNMWIPGFGSEDLRPYKKAATTEAHKQRMALIKKTLKKY